VAGLDLDVATGTTHGLVGESGCGKSTAARTILRLIEPTAGSVRFDGVELTSLGQPEMQRLRSQIQVVFQDAIGAFNQRMTVAAIVAEPLLIHQSLTRSERSIKVGQLLESVGLDAEGGSRYPHELSGGQRQRIGIARALALSPRLLICDEPVSALDVSVRAQILELLTDLQLARKIAYLFISHDLAVVDQVAHRVSVMYLGRIVESGTKDQVYRTPAHPYTQALLSAIPQPDPIVERTRKRIILTGELPNPSTRPSGCAFRSRCWKAQELCAQEAPALIGRGGGHTVACHFPDTALSSRVQLAAPPLS
jgi:peptide/nickel transport system ATP-binding protein/oligopeptide transport system ATP-binding protein